MRRLRRNNRGQIRVIEAFFASVLIFSSLALIPSFQKSSNDSLDSLSSTAYNTLLSLDSNGHLASLVDNGSWIELKDSIQSALSPGIWFNVTVFSENMNPLNDIPISSGSAVNDKIAAVDYVCSSTSSNYAVYIIRLQLATVT